MGNQKPIGVAYLDQDLKGSNIRDSEIEESVVAATRLSFTQTFQGGTSLLPIGASSGNIAQIYGTATNLTGDVRALYTKLNFTGIGGSGETFRAFSTVSANCADGGTINGAHISMSVLSGGSISGAGNALRATLGAASGTTPGGTLAAIQLDSDIASGVTVPAITSFLRVTDTNTVKIPNLLNMPNPASNTIFRAKSAAAVTHVIKMVAADGTPYYIMVSDQP